jgi:hypothetical protein
LDNYPNLLIELGKLIQIPLKVDANNSCMITFPKEKIEIQIEHELSTDMLIIGSNIAKLPPGRFRQNLFEQSLKANNLDNPRGGILAFSPRSDMLVIFTKLAMKDLKPEDVAQAMIPFKDKLKKWKDGIQNNEVPQLLSSGIKTPSSGMFGLK